MRFPVIVIDPPWKFITRSQKGQGRAPEYNLMTKQRLLDLPIQRVCAKDCVLFMWTSGPYMDFAIQLGKHWGFRFSTISHTWVKPTRKTIGKFIPNIQDDVNWAVGTGYVTRANPEFVVCFKIGQPKRQVKNVRHLIVRPRAKQHSAKPEILQDGIERLFVGPYLEIFARRFREPWFCFGDELTGNDIYEDLDRIAKLGG